MLGHRELVGGADRGVHWVGDQYGRVSSEQAGLGLRFVWREMSCSVGIGWVRLDLSMIGSTVQYVASIDA